MYTLLVTINKQTSGYYFGLSPKVRKELSELFPGSTQLSHVFIAYDTKVVFEEIYGHIEKHLLPVLTGVEMALLSTNVQDVQFIDPYEKKPIYTISLSHVQETEPIPG